MSKLELEAIRALPEQYVRDGTCYCLYNDCVVVMEAMLPALIYRNGKWTPMDLEQPESK